MSCGREVEEGGEMVLDSGETLRVDAKREKYRQTKQDLKWPREGFEAF